MKDLITKHVQIGDDLISYPKWSWLPTHICDVCRRCLREADNPEKFLTTVDYDSLQPPQTYRLKTNLVSNTVTRGSLIASITERERAEREEETNCDCSVCTVARLSAGNMAHHNIIMYEPVDRRREIEMVLFYVNILSK